MKDASDQFVDDMSVIALTFPNDESNVKQRVGKVVSKNYFSN